MKKTLYGFVIGVALAIAGSVIAAVSSAPAPAPTLQVFTGSGTWNKPGRLAAIEITVVGGGGGSGGCPAVGAAQGSASGGGGGAATAIKRIAASALGATETVTVGAAGAAGAAGANGGAGGASSFGAHATANGGGGSTQGSPAATGVAHGKGGTGGTATGGDINIQGSDGEFGLNHCCAGRHMFGAKGGASSLNGGQNTATTLSVGAIQAAVGFGVGGPGMVLNDSLAARVGNAGAAGVVYVREFYR